MNVYVSSEDQVSTDFNGEPELEDTYYFVMIDNNDDKIINSVWSDRYSVFMMLELIDRKKVESELIESNKSTSVWCERLINAVFSEGVDIRI